MLTQKLNIYRIQKTTFFLKIYLWTVCAIKKNHAFSKMFFQLIMQIITFIYVHFLNSRLLDHTNFLMNKSGICKIFKTWWFALTRFPCNAIEFLALRFACWRLFNDICQSAKTNTNRLELCDHIIMVSHLTKTHLFAWLGIAAQIKPQNVVLISNI